MSTDIIDTNNHAFLVALVQKQAAQLETVAAYCDQAASRISTDPDVGDYERGFDDSTRGMSARILSIVGFTK